MLVETSELMEASTAIAGRSPSSQGFLRPNFLIILVSSKNVQKNIQSSSSSNFPASKTKLNSSCMIILRNKMSRFTSSIPKTPLSSHHKVFHLSCSIVQKAEKVFNKFLETSFQSDIVHPFNLLKTFSRCISIRLCNQMDIEIQPEQ